MKYRWPAFLVSPLLALTLGGCSEPDTPQQVATEFWQSLAQNEESQAVELSTLTESAALGGLNLNDLKTPPDFGQIVIDADQASIVTRLPAADGTTGEYRELLTHLVRVDDQWRVDFQATRDAITERSALSGLMSDIDRFSKQLDEGVGETSDKLSRRLDDLTEQFTAYSEETGKKAEEALEQFGRSFQDLKQQIEQSLDDAENKRKQEQQKEGSDQLAI